MEILIEDTELELLLEKNKNRIGNKWTSNIDILATSIFYILTTVPAEYPIVFGIQGMQFKIGCLCIGILYFIYGIALIIKSIKNRYCHTDLYNSIKQLNRIEHPFSIIAIKDTFNLYPNQFLLYYDERWDCKFFPNYKTVENDDELNKENIRKRLSNALKIDKNNISVEFKEQRIQRKFSVSNQRYKVYDHKLYYVEISEFTDNIKQHEFKIDGTKYFWMSIKEMENDENIKQKNSDVVGFVKETIA